MTDNYYIKQITQLTIENNIMYAALKQLSDNIKTQKGTDLERQISLSDIVRINRALRDIEGR